MLIASIIILACIGWALLGSFNNGVITVLEPKLDLKAIFFILGPIGTFLILCRVFVEFGEKIGKFILDFNSPE